MYFLAHFFVCHGKKNISLILHIESNFLTESCAKFQLKTLANFSRLLDGCILTSLLCWPCGSIRFYSHPSSIIIHFPFVNIVEFLIIRSNKDVMVHLSQELLLQLHCFAAVWSKHRVFAYLFINTYRIKSWKRKVENWTLGVLDIAVAGVLCTAGVVTTHLETLKWPRFVQLLSYLFSI